MNYRITKQRSLYAYNEVITQSNITKTIEIEAHYYKPNHDDFIIDEGNIERIRSITNKDFKIGEKYILPLKSLSFFNESDFEIQTINVFADPYYKLEEYINDNWVVIDKHNHD